MSAERNPTGINYTGEWLTWLGISVSETERRLGISPGTVAMGQRRWFVKVVPEWLRPLADELGLPAEVLLTRHPLDERLRAVALAALTRAANGRLTQRRTRSRRRKGTEAAAV